MTDSAVLLDVNVLFALGWDNHPHFGRCQRWMAARRGRPWATCPIVQCDFLRLSSQARANPTPVTPDGAADLLRRLTAEPGHAFWPDDLPPLDVPTAGLRGHNQITDAYLVALARHHGGRLATMDAAAAGLPGAAAAVEVIP